MIIESKNKGFKRVIIPYDSLEEATHVNDIEILGFKKIDDVVRFIEGRLYVESARGHNMFMLGPPGCGKSMIAKRIPIVLPDLKEEEPIAKFYLLKLCLWK